MKIEIIQNTHTDMLNEFCNTCKNLGYMNNASIKEMKLSWCKSQGGEFWCAINNNKIVAVAGCYPLKFISSNAWRIMYRGCELPYHDTFKGLGKGDWNSITQREFIPIMINWCNSRELYITTNTTYDHSNGKAARNHKLMGLLAKQKILDNLGDIMLHSTEQTLWKLNIDEYTRRRARIKNRYVD